MTASRLNRRAAFFGREAKRITLIRTFKPVGSGAPVPPLGLLYIASALRKAFAGCLIELLDIGQQDLSIEEIEGRIAVSKPHMVGLSTLTCEVDVMRQVAEAVKKTSPHTMIVVGGPYASSSRQAVLDDRNIDVVVIREGEESIVELVRALEKGDGLSQVRGIAYRDERGEPLLAEPRDVIRDLDGRGLPAWDMVDLPAYSIRRNWSGPLKRSFYAPIITSRGCPYECTFCHDLFGKRVRFRSPENVYSEIEHLYRRFGCREFHIVDDIFNVDAKRAEKICRLIIDSGMDVSFSFPNGLRADIMTDSLLGLLKAAGTYRINYGFETVTPRLQMVTRKHLDVDKAARMIEKTSELGIITGAYFMLGIPSETAEEMLATIRYARDSGLDVAAFFKPTAYPGTAMYDAVIESGGRALSDKAEDLHFQSARRSYAEVSDTELNAMIIRAQREFYFDLERILRGFRKAPRKLAYAGNLFTAAILVLQGYLIHELNLATAQRRGERS